MTDRMQEFMRRLAHAEGMLKTAERLQNYSYIVYSQVRVRKAEEDVAALWTIENDGLDKEKGR